MWHIRNGTAILVIIQAAAIPDLKIPTDGWHPQYGNSSYVPATAVAIVTSCWEALDAFCISAVLYPWPRLPRRAKLTQQRLGSCRTTIQTSTGGILQASGGWFFLPCPCCLNNLLAPWHKGGGRSLGLL